MKVKIIFLVSLMFIILSFLVNIYPGKSIQQYSINIAFIDVGEGDSALLQTSDGFNILIDGGVVSEGPAVLDYLRNNGVATLHSMIASHADSDHIGGLITVLNATDITVDSVIYNGYPGNTQTWNDFIMAVSDEGLTLTTAQFPSELHWGTTIAYVMNPLAGLVNPDSNDASLVLLLEHDAIRTLFTGDIDSTIESEIIARGTPIAADILKAAHHGSNYSTSFDFLNAVQPQDAVISVGANPYGHPGAYALARLHDIGSIIWRTDFNGTILVTSSDGLTYQVIPSRIRRYLFLPLTIKNTP